VGRSEQVTIPKNPLISSSRECQYQVQFKKNNISSNDNNNKELIDKKYYIPNEKQISNFANHNVIEI
jgi:hypothetical protein